MQKEGNGWMSLVFFIFFYIMIPFSYPLSLYSGIIANVNFCIAIVFYSSSIPFVIPS